ASGHASLGSGPVGRGVARAVVRGGRGAGDVYRQPPDRGAGGAGAFPQHAGRLRGMAFASLDDWAMEVYGQTIPPDGVIYAGLGRRLCPGGDPWAVAVIVEPKTSPFGGPRPLELYSCTERFVAPGTVSSGRALPP